MEFNAYTYSFPFKKPFETSSHTFKTRTGIVLELKEDELIALGEAAPLPGFSIESLEDVSAQLKKFSSPIEDLLRGDLSLETLQVFHRKNEIYPSLQFALDTLAVDYLSLKAGIPAQDFLFEDPATTLQTNAVVSIEEDNKTILQVGEFVENGYSTIKIKVGRDFNNEIGILKQIRSAYPKLVLRLDANRAWELNEAIENLSELEHLGIEYCEEPLTGLSIQNLKKLHNSVSVPLALDESILEIQNIETVMPFVSVIVIKPMVLGSLSKLFATNRLVNSHNNKVIYTTSLESGIGRTMTVILASGLGSRGSAHGLSTGSLLKMDVWNDGTYINNGSVYLPDRSELGKRYHSNHTYLKPGRMDL